MKGEGIEPYSRFASVRVLDVDNGSPQTTSDGANDCGELLVFRHLVPRVVLDVALDELYEARRAVHHGAKTFRENGVGMLLDKALGEGASGFHVWAAE